MYMKHFVSKELNMWEGREGWEKNIWSLGRGQHHCDEEDIYIYIIKTLKEGIYIILKK